MNRGLLSGHPMGDHSHRLSYSLVLLMLMSILVPFTLPNHSTELEEKSSLEHVSSRSSTLIDVADWRIGDEWIYDAEFDVEDLIAGGAPGSQVGVLTGLLTREVVDIRTDTIDNVSTIVYELESSGTFNYNGATIVASGFNVGGDLEVDLEMEEVIRASDLSQITYNMNLDVDFDNIGDEGER